MRTKFKEVRGRVGRARDERRLERQFMLAPAGVQADILAAMQRRGES